MTGLFAARTTTVPIATFQLGQAVHVNARTAWLSATVTSIAHTGIGVAYAAQLLAGGGPRARTVAPWVVRPAAGVRLRAVHLLRAGDDLLAFDGTARTVATVWRGLDRWWVIAYTNGERSAVPPQAILRLTDPTPPVSVNGIPL
jgi:hypothetical protein